MDVPENMESYYQEAGRAGRDEKKAYAVLIYHPNDITELKEWVNQTSPNISYIKSIYQSLANYFRIAIGSSHLASYDLIIEEFCHQYQLKSIETYQAIKKLEDEGLVQLIESYYAPAKVHIHISHKTLYEFQVSQPHFDQMIKVLLRAYGGELYASFSTISEEKIARLLDVEVSEVLKMLDQLHKRKVLIYIPSKNKPQLTWLTERKDAKSLTLNEKKIVQRDKERRQKMKSMINYLENQHQCRQQFILSYFNEDYKKLCGICDYCLNQKYEVDVDPSQYRVQILAELNNSPLSTDMLVSRIDLKNKKEVIDTIREMIDRREIKFDKSGKVQIEYRG